MFVLTKLMDAQINGPIVDPKKKGLKRKRIEDDPVRQIKKIRRIEKKFTDEERKARMQAAKMEALKTEQNDTIPGKKLPIWKRKIPPEIPGASLITTTPRPLTTSTPTTLTPSSDLGPQRLTPVSRPPPGKAYFIAWFTILKTDHGITTKKVLLQFLLNVNGIANILKE
jgi:hypothetical protein